MCAVAVACRAPPCAVAARRRLPPQHSTQSTCVCAGILSDLEVWSGSRRILQIKGKSSAAAPLPDACFAPVSREALHFLVAEAGESCPEVCQRAGYGTSDSGYGAFSGGDGADESVLCRVELEGATHLFGENRRPCISQ